MCVCVCVCFCVGSESFSSFVVVLCQRRVSLVLKLFLKTVFLELPSV